MWLFLASGIDLDAFLIVGAKMINLGILTEIKDLREVWPHEAHDFTPWIVKNIGVLSDTEADDIIKEFEGDEYDLVDGYVLCDFRGEV